MNLLKIKNLNKVFCKDGICVAKNISFEIKRGEIFTLMGRSGSGKSSLLRMICGFEKPDGGEIILGEKQIFSENIDLEPKKRELSMVFQNYALFPHLSVKQNILFGSDEIAKKRLKDLLEKVGISAIKDRYPHEISGGQQQRVALCRALIRAPKILLLDEPFSNIDTELRATLRVELKEMIRAFDMTALFVTHDREDAFYMSDRIAVMDSGEILQIGRPRVLYDRAKNFECAKFLGKVNFFDFGKRKVGVRPENLEIHSSGEIEVMVKDCIFHGSYCEVIGDSSFGEITLYTKNDVNINKSIRVKILKEIPF